MLRWQINCMVIAKLSWVLELLSSDMSHSSLNHAVFVVYVAWVFSLRWGTSGWLLADHGEWGYRTGGFPHRHPYHTGRCFYHCSLHPPSNEKFHCYQHREGQGPATHRAAFRYLILLYKYRSSDFIWTHCFFWKCEKNILLRQWFSSFVSGDPSVLVRLIHDGQLRLDRIEDHSEDELRTILDRCGSSVAPDCNKVGVCVRVCVVSCLLHSEEQKPHFP